MTAAPREIRWVDPGFSEIADVLAVYGEPLVK